ncbi:MAG: phosphatidate cytidylyltransferase [Francisellaceae bacterium]
MKQRIITGVILGLLVLWAIFGFGSLIFNLCILAILLLGAWEWTQFCGCDKPWSKVIYLVITVMLIYLSSGYVVLTMVVALLFWIWAVLLLWRYTKDQKPTPLMFRYVFGFLVIVPLFSAISVLHQYRPTLLLVLMLIVAFADSGAYFVGRKMGRHKLAPVISPKKSWEGLAGGVVFGGSVGVIASLFLNLSLLGHLGMIVMSFLLVIIALVGDLFESMIKRQCGIKDSGTILPGHGGILDRMDSLFSTIPIYAFFMIITGIIYLS